MKRCAFLTIEDIGNCVSDDHIAVPFLEQLGWRVDFLPWRADVDWDDYDVVIPRSTWDYQSEPVRFDAVLQRIEESRALLLNPLPLMRWNMSKTYLRDLAARGVPSIPTAWLTSPSAGELRALFDRLGTDELVIKPVIGASAGDAFRLDRVATAARLDALARTFTGRDCLVQPFMPHIATEGEYSLTYIDGVHTHTLVKTPKPGDFRVQESHGGGIAPAQASPALARAAAAAMAALAEVPLYARVDFVRVTDDSWGLMEFELIEPALYFRISTQSASAFARAIDLRHAAAANGDIASAAAGQHGAEAGHG